MGLGLDEKSVGKCEWSPDHRVMLLPSREVAGGQLRGGSEEVANRKLSRSSGEKWGAVLIGPDQYALLCSDFMA